MIAKLRAPLANIRTDLQRKERQAKAYVDRAALRQWLSAPEVPGRPACPGPDLPPDSEEAPEGGS